MSQLWQAIYLFIYLFGAKQKEHTIVGCCERKWKINANVSGYKFYRFSIFTILKLVLKVPKKKPSGTWDSKNPDSYYSNDVVFNSYRHLKIDAMKPDSLLHSCQRILWRIPIRWIRFFGGFIVSRFWTSVQGDSSILHLVSLAPGNQFNEIFFF